MGRKIKLSESRLIDMISTIVKEHASLGGFGYGFVKEQNPTQPAGEDIMSTLESNESWSKLKQFFKDYYTNVKTKVADVSPSEFNEIEMVVDAIISLAREINLNNKSPEVIAQQLRRHMKDLVRQSDATKKAAEKNKPQKEAPPLEEGKKLFSRLKNKITEQNSGSHPSTWGVGFSNNGCPGPDEAGPVPQNFANNIGSGPSAYALWANWITQNKPNWGCTQLENRTLAYHNQVNTNMANSNGDGTGCSPKWNNMLMAKIVGTRAKGLEMGCGQ